MTITTRAEAGAILTPDEIRTLLLDPVEAASTAAAVSTLIPITGPALRIPKMTETPSARWVSEGTEIGLSEAKFDELRITPTKLAGLTAISNELAADSSPEAQQQVGQKLAADVAAKIDTAYLSTVEGDEAADAQQGLEHQDATELTTAEGWTDGLDIFSEAVFTAEGNGAHLTHWLANPADALALVKLREADGSNRQLLQPDPTEPGRRIIDGKPLITDRNVTPGTIWGVDNTQSLLVVRQDAEITTSESVYFSKDSTAVRVIMRVGLGFTNPAGIMKITTA
ncbi:MAG: phage major capsid protein [Nesterenkonia sp.]|nr:phage major capsid protein [Nesterenkonia sp.]